MVALAALTFLTSACTAGTPPPQLEQPPSSSPTVTDEDDSQSPSGHVNILDAEEVIPVIRATRRLGLETLAANPRDTILTSPASTVISLAMLGTQSTGEAEDQFSMVLGASDLKRDEAVNALLGTLTPYEFDPETFDAETLPDSSQLHIANQVVIDSRITPKPGYLESLQAWFDAGVLEADFASDSGYTALDQWIRENTGGLIQKSAIEPSPDLRLVLQNAVLFAARWEDPFEKSATSPMLFTTADGREIEVDALHGQKAASYSEVDGWQMVELPYAEGELAARLVLPPPDVFPTATSMEEIAALENALTPTSVQISIPKIDLNSSVDLSAPVQRAGLTAIFVPDPPGLQNISDDRNLAVDQIIQQGRIIMDEDGTLAAATTEAGVSVTSGALLDEVEATFVADRPYLVFIVERKVGWDLFSLLVSDPQARDKQEKN